MPYQRYDRKDSRSQHSNSVVSPWATGYPQGNGPRPGPGLLPLPNDQLSLAGNLLGSLLGGNTLAVAQALQQTQGQGMLPLGPAFGGDRGRPGMPMQSRSGGGGRLSSPPRARPFRRSRSRSPRDNRRRGARSPPRKRQMTSPKRFRSPPKERAAHEIYIGNYPLRFRESELRKLFEDHGVKVLNIRMKNEGQKVFAFAETDTKEEIEKAVKMMDSKEIMGRRLRVRSAKDRDAPAGSAKPATTKSSEKKERELTEGDVSRHLAFAFVGFLERQLTQEGVNDDALTEMTVAKEAIIKAFTLPEDDSLKVTRRLETIFLQNNRREIKIEEPAVDIKEEEKLEAKEEAEGDDSIVEKEAETHDEEDDSGNWKRRRITKSEDEDEDELEMNGKQELDDATVEKGADVETVGGNQSHIDDQDEDKLEGKAEKGDEPEIQLENDEDLDDECEPTLDTTETPTKSPAASGRGTASRGRSSLGRARRSRGRRGT